MPRWLNKLFASLVALALLAAPAASHPVLHSELGVSAASHSHDLADGQAVCGGDLCCGVCLFTLTPMPDLPASASLKRLRSAPYPARFLAGTEPVASDPPPRYNFR
jgi:hypothetical protein